MRWLITRPRDDAEALARRLQELGHESHICPLMQRRAISFLPPDWSDYDAVAFTSRNGVAMGGPYPPEALTLPVFAVGDATALAARDAGFSHVVSSNGTGADLAAELARQADKGEKSAKNFRVLHLSGETVRTDLNFEKEGEDTSSSLIVDRLAAYAMQPIDVFDDQTIAALESDKISGTICLSPQSAKNFAKAAASARLTPFSFKFIFAAISPATARELADLGGEIRIAAKPDLENTLALLS